MEDRETERLGNWNKLENYQIGGLENLEAGELVDWETGGLGNWETGWVEAKDTGGLDDLKAQEQEKDKRKIYVLPEKFREMSVQFKCCQWRVAETDSNF